MFDYLNPYFNLKTNVVDTKLNKSKMYNTFIFYDFSPHMIIPSNYEDFKNSHKGKFWGNIRRSKKILREELGDYIFEKQYNKTAISNLEEFREIFLTKWKNSYTSFSWKSDLGFDKFKVILDEIIEKNPNTFETATLRLKSNNTILAYSLGFKIDDTYYFFMHNINYKYNKSKYNLGTIFLEYLIKSFIENKGITQFDFMLGINPYKMKWTKTIKPIYWVIYTDKTLYGFFIHYIKVCVFYIKIKIQKNKILSKKIKSLFTVMSKFNISNRLLHLLDKKLFKM